MSKKIITVGEGVTSVQLPPMRLGEEIEITNTSSKVIEVYGCPTGVVSVSPKGVLEYLQVEIPHKPEDSPQ